MYALKIFLTILFASAFVSAVREKDNFTLPDPHLTIFGATGVGKSSLANVLLGEPYDCKNCTFPVCSGGDSCTKATTYAIGKWVGEGSNFTVVDTPGYGDSDNDDNKLMDEMVDALKENISTTNGFLLMFRGDDERFDEGIQQMLREFQAMFGETFWNFTTIGVSYWHYDNSSIERREEEGKNEAWYCAEKNKGLKEHFDVFEDIPCVFIDSHAHFDDESEKTAFDKETSKLWEYINSTAQFEFLSFQDILEELDEEKRENKRLHELIDDEIEELYGLIKQETNERTLTDGNLTHRINGEQQNRREQDIEIKGLIQQETNFREIEDNFITGELATEKKERDNSDQKIRDDISVVDTRVGTLENTAAIYAIKCSSDSNCYGKAVCNDGWCNLLPECIDQHGCSRGSSCFQGFCYDYRKKTYMPGTQLGPEFSNAEDAIIYCNNHSNCDGVEDWDCDGAYYRAKDGTPTPDTEYPSCTWVRT